MLPRCCISSPILSAAECELIKETIEPNLKKGTIGGGKINRKVRDTLSCFINSKDCLKNGKYQNLKESIQKIVNSLIHIAKEAYLTDINYVESINFSKYEIGGHYKWHIDSQKKGNGRDISASFFLDDPITYKGGELEFFDRGIDNPPQRQGCLCLFPSLLTHRVKKVTSGKRSALILWGHIINPNI